MPRMPRMQEHYTALSIPLAGDVASCGHAWEEGQNEEEGGLTHLMMGFLQGAFLSVDR